MKKIILSKCENMMPIAKPKASVSKIKGFERFA
jgi:hypothetical protein